MLLVKKLIFAPFFLIFFIILLSQLSTKFSSYDFIFSLSLQTFLQIIIISALITLSSFFFILFATFADDWKFILPLGFLGTFSSMFFLDQPIGLIFAVISLASLIIVSFGLGLTLKTYLTFQPDKLLTPYIKNLTTFLIITISVCYFFSINKVISSEITSGKGFQIPDSLIESSLKFIPLDSITKDSEASELPAIPPEQLELLKQNPKLLEQYGLDPSILDSLATKKDPKELSKDVIKQTLKNQLNKILEPYLPFIPAGLAVLLFILVNSVTYPINLLIHPLIWILFFILEKTEFVKFVEEQRPVKRMVV